MLLTSDGRPLITDFGLTKDLSDAKDRLTQIKSEVALGKWSPREERKKKLREKAVTFRKFVVDTFLKERDSDYYREALSEPNPKGRIKRRGSAIMRFFGDRRLSDITTEVGEEFKRERSKEVGPSTVRKRRARATQRCAESRPRSRSTPSRSRPRSCGSSSAAAPERADPSAPR